MAEDFDEELDEILNPKKRGLGRGLGALFEDEEGDYPAVEEPTTYSEEPPTAYRKVVGIEKLTGDFDAILYLEDVNYSTEEVNLLLKDILTDVAA